MKTVLILVLAAGVAAGCSRHSKGSSASQTTQTIAPADGMPAPNGSDTMTQTVDVDDSRSEADGMTTTATQPAKASAKTPAKTPSKKKGHK